MGTLGRSAQMYSSIDGTPTCRPEFANVAPAGDGGRPNDARTSSAQPGLADEPTRLAPLTESASPSKFARSSRNCRASSP
jgi:hypothetical protein